MSDETKPEAEIKPQAVPTADGGGQPRTEADHKAEAKPKRVRRPKEIHEVIFYTYPKFVFCWPIIAMGFLLWPFDRWHIIGPETLAWVWGLTLLLVILTIGVDVNRNYAVFWLVVIAGLWVLVLWLRDVKHLAVFGWIYRFFINLDPVYSRSLGLIVSIPLLVVFGILWVWTRINSRWRITHNEFEHYQFGRLDDSIARGAKRLRSSYPDLLELLICLAGDLVIFDASGRRELRRIQHVPLLPWVKKRVNILLEATAVTAEHMDDEAASEPCDEDASPESESKD